MTQIDALFGNSFRPADIAGDGFAVTEAADASVAEPAWAELVGRAGEPNPFLAPWFARASLRHLDAQAAVRSATLIRSGSLEGLALLRGDKTYHGKPLPHTALWLHDNAFLGTPLIAPGHERAFWQGLLDWCDRHLATGLFLSLPCQTERGPVLDALRTLCREQGRTFGIVDSGRRALLAGGSSAENRLTTALGTKKRKELRRQRRRLEELGELTVERLREPHGLSAWIDQFLALEGAGWKGREGSALGDSRRRAAMFRDALTGAGAAGALERLALRLDGKPVAMLATFLSPPGAFSFKTAFDEDYARFSPGVLLQLENLALLDDPALDWCDSCAATGHPMIDHIWRDRRDIVTLNVAIGGPLRRAAGAALIRYEAGRHAARSKDQPL